MLIINPTDKQLPNPVEVDISRLVETSSLLGASFSTPLPGDLQLEGAMSRQQDAIAGGDVLDTGLVLEGGQLAVSASDQAIQTRADVEEDQDGGAVAVDDPPPTTGEGGGGGTGVVEGRASNPAFVISEQSTITPDAITTPGFGTLPGMNGEFEVPVSPANDADLAFSGTTNLTDDVLISTAGILDVSGNVNSDHSLTLSGQDISFGEIDVNLVGADLGVFSSSHAPMEGEGGSNQRRHHQSYRDERECPERQYPKCA